MLVLIFWNPAQQVQAETVIDNLPAPLGTSDFPIVDQQQARLGQLLFYDKILSGNRNISCGTCHHHDTAGSDGLSLGIGEGGAGLALNRTPGDGADKIKRRISRNAPALWNLGATDIRVLFHDGRLFNSDDYDNGFNSPAEERLPEGLDSLLAAQAVFPIASRREMAGDPEENSVARAAFDRIDHVWPIITKRVAQIPGYAGQFINAFPHIERAADIRIADIANALAAFMTIEFQSYDSPFDAYLAGDESALDETQQRGLALFYGKGGCADCHSGPLLTDQSFHALALPVLGPGRTRLYDPIPRDVGRMAETDALEDAYRFRTPSLRNVALTAPYGHNGAYATLEGIIEHHLDPSGAFDRWRRSNALLPDVPWLNETDLLIRQDKREMARYLSRLDIQPKSLDDMEQQAILRFLHTLTGETAMATPLGVPDSVPSGLPVDRAQ